MTRRETAYKKTDDPHREVCLFFLGGILNRMDPLRLIRHAARYLRRTIREKLRRPAAALPILLALTVTLAVLVPSDSPPRPADAPTLFGDIRLYIPDDALPSYRLTLYP